MNEEMDRDKDKANGEATQPASQTPELSQSELDQVAGGRDAASGLAVGQRSHKPYTVTS
jgi:hypothetical protein